MTDQTKNLVILGETSYYIYKYTFENGKSYIGQTNNLIKRISRHKSGESGCTAFSNAIAKYGWQYSRFSILEEGLTLEESNELEPTYIIEYNTISPYGYNLLPGGDNRSCHKTTKVKIRLGNKGKKRTVEQKERQKKLTNAAKDYIVVTPKGETILVHNLTRYCEKYSLNKTCMGFVAAGTQKQHKGYTCSYAGEEEWIILNR